MKLNLDDTIAAIATPIGEAGIGIVRLSGPRSLEIADAIFSSKDGVKPSEFHTYTTHYGWISKGADIVDEVLLTVMKAPKSYTKEDIVEINCHGGIAPLKDALDICLGLGARLAEPGEFTKRAFLNGRIDLAQAEAVLDIIRARTQKGLKLAISQLEGGISDAIRGFREGLIDVKVHLEASVDFPEEGLSVFSRPELESQLNRLKGEMDKLLKSFETGKAIREGINCVICGKTNAGKSSLMNALLKEERVIVTPIPGTTRDAVSEAIDIEGVPINLVDTAGISDTNDTLEKEGIRKSRLWMDKADLILFMIDAGTGITAEDMRIIELIRGKKIICVVNKIDLKDDIDRDSAVLCGLLGEEAVTVKISVLKKINLEGLIKAVSDKIRTGEVSQDDSGILTNARHKDCVSKASAAVEEALFSLKEGQPEEIIAISLDEAVSALGEVTGNNVSEEVLDRIFGQFCVGK
ncbi:MAG: tRNA uridine-5-carboxymethylaminomethyl(34) synthesis GTPase MnmE [Candidatus Omnitrophica bacterium]|nr:tRNA uridine-5-carboxymethylaminomethyl(34) synthesis GTPase MnmE [Candidatus Omnitrophota bacterium]